MWRRRSDIYHHNLCSCSTARLPLRSPCILQLLSPPAWAPGRFPCLLSSIYSIQCFRSSSDPPIVSVCVRHKNESNSAQCRIQPHFRPGLAWREGQIGGEGADCIDGTEGTDGAGSTDGADGIDRAVLVPCTHH